MTHLPSLRPDLRARLASEGGAPLPGTPDDYAAVIDREERQWGALVSQFNLKIDDRQAARDSAARPGRRRQVGRRRRRRRRSVAVLARDRVLIETLLPARLAVVGPVDDGVDDRPGGRGARLVAQPLDRFDLRGRVHLLVLERRTVHLLQLVWRHVEQVARHLAFRAAR